MKIKVIDVNGAEVKDLELDEYVFGIAPNKSVIYEAIKNELANRRQGTASTKTKSEVSGTGAKPWKQKGTGRARSGVKRSPVWVGGGVAFGPKPRDYSYKIPKKIKNLAYRSLLSLKCKSDNVMIVDNIKLENGKTKELVSIVNKLVDSGKVSFVVTDSDQDLLVKRAGRNIPTVKCLSYKRLNVHDLYYSDKLVFTEEAVDSLSKMLNNKEG